MKNIYSFVDESGQHTLGKQFVVSIISVEGDTVELEALCKKFEKESKKGAAKWGRAVHSRRMDYLRRVFRNKQFRNSLRFSYSKGTRKYHDVTIRTIVAALKTVELTEKHVNIVNVDALSAKDAKRYKKRIRNSGLNVKHVRGVRKDENHALIRLADAIAGFVMDAEVQEEDGEIRVLYERVKKQGILKEVE